MPGVSTVLVEAVDDGAGAGAVGAGAVASAGGGSPVATSSDEAAVAPRGLRGGRVGIPGNENVEDRAADGSNTAAAEKRGLVT